MDRTAERTSLPSTDGITISVSDLTDATVASSVAVRFATACGYERREAVEIGIVVRELATNVVKHSGGAGTIKLTFRCDQMFILAVDEGPGMANPRELLEDRPPRVELSDGLGQGGGAIRRLMDVVRVENHPLGGLEVEAVKRRARVRRRE